MSHAVRKRSDSATRLARHGLRTLCATSLVCWLGAAGAWAQGLAPQRPANQAEANPLSRVAQSMERAKERIAEKDTGAETRALQSKAVRDLDELIKLAEQQSPPSSQPPPSSPQPMPQPESQKSPQPQSQPMPSPQPQSSATESERAKQSTDRKEAAGAGEKQGQRQTDLLRSVWGHLPPSLRQELLNVPEEKYLPRYSELVRSYFEALADESPDTGRTKP